MTDSQTPEPAQEPASAPPEAPASAAPPVAAGAPSRRSSWAAAAVIVALIGAVASIIGARSVAHSDSSKAAAQFHQSSTAIASTLALAVQHEEDLALSAGSFFAANPGATPAQFQAWAQATHVLHRYPEVERLALVSIVHAGEITSFSARLNGMPATAAAAAQAPALAVSPATAHRYYCLSAAEVSRSAFVPAASAHDFCASGTALLLARTAGTVYYQPASGAAQKLALFTPVYRGAVKPSSVEGRRAAFVGWLREVLNPSVVMQRALSGHPSNADPPQPHRRRLDDRLPGRHAGSRSPELHRGGSRRVDAAELRSAPGPGVFGDGDALALLITGLLLSALAGVLVYLLGVRSTPQPARVQSTPAPPKDDLYDPLTGLPNRALMLDRADRMLARAGRQSGMLVGALFVDIDWFKDVTDRLGQDAGDQMIKIVAETARGRDPHATTPSAGSAATNSWSSWSPRPGARAWTPSRAASSTPCTSPSTWRASGPAFALTASIGVAFGRYTGPDDLLRDARTALIAAKAAGKDRYTVFNANMRSVVEGRGSWNPS